MCNTWKTLQFVRSAISTTCHSPLYLIYYNDFVRTSSYPQCYPHVKIRQRNGIQAKFSVNNRASNLRGQRDAMLPEVETRRGEARRDEARRGVSAQTGVPKSGSPRPGSKRGAAGRRSASPLRTLSVTRRAEPILRYNRTISIDARALHSHIINLK